jgi:tetraprenyl-beta-curcumene synthase
MDHATLVSALGTYQLAVLPRVRRELLGWEQAAEAIPDPALRATALSALREKNRNAEATAVFAILAPRRERPVALRAITALQTAVDYLDTLGEQPADDPLANGMALHEALIEAVTPAAERSDWYRLHPHGDDGGYLAALAGACRNALAKLPAAEAVAPALRRAVRRCGEGQSHTHAAALAGPEELEGWALAQAAPPGYRWWEVAAGASSSVAAHALIAAAADPGTTAAEADLIDAAYFPPTGALTVLLDDLVDRERDVAAGEHNYMAYYSGSSDAADRLAQIAERAKAATAQLRQRGRHAAILAGVAGFYLSSTATRSEYAAPIRARMLESLGGSVRPILFAMRLKRRG